MTTQKAKAARYSATDLKNLCILPENSIGGLGSRRDCCWSYIPVFEDSPKKLISKFIFSIFLKLMQLHLVVKGRVQLQHSSYTVKVNIKTTC